MCEKATEGSGKVLRKKEKWRTRTQGTPRQIGTKFKLLAREAKTKLPKALESFPTQVQKKLDELNIEQKEEGEELTEEELETLASEIDYALAVKDEEKLAEIGERLEELGIDTQKLIDRIVDEYPEIGSAKPKVPLSQLKPIGRTKTGKIIYERVKREKKEEV
jgi:gas vesicle protein